MTDDFGVPRGVGVEVEVDSLDRRVDVVEGLKRGGTWMGKSFSSEYVGSEFECGGEDFCGETRKGSSNGTSRTGLASTRLCCLAVADFSA